jgi:uncharacterized protein
VKPQFRLHLDHSWHGISHWARVWHNARLICQELQLDPTVPCWFSFLHDSQRFDDGIDHLHGPRACEWIDRLDFEGLLPVSRSDLQLLTTAIAGHSNGETQAHPLVMVCWDADRLDLGRVGIMPDARYLCTEVAKRHDVIQKAWNRSVGLAQRG